VSKKLKFHVGDITEFLKFKGVLNNDGVHIGYGYSNGNGEGFGIGQNIGYTKHMMEDRGIGCGCGYDISFGGNYGYGYGCAYGVDNGGIYDSGKDGFSLHDGVDNVKDRRLVGDSDEKA